MTNQYVENAKVILTLEGLRLSTEHIVQCDIIAVKNGNAKKGVWILNFLMDHSEEKHLLVLNNFHKKNGIESKKFKTALTLKKFLWKFDFEVTELPIIEGDIITVSRIVYH